MKKNVMIKAFVFAVGLSVIPLFAHALDYPHNDINTIGCSSCHITHSGGTGLLPPHTPADIDDTQINNLCWSCHNDVTAPYEKTHSSLTIDNGYGDWTVECTTCHEPHKQKQFRAYGGASYLDTGTLTAVTAVPPPPPTDDLLEDATATWIADEYKGFIVFPDITDIEFNSYKIKTNDTTTLAVTEQINTGKVAPGDTYAIVYGKLIRETITTPNSGDKPTRLFRSTGNNSFADGDATYDGVCEVCHTQTTHFRNDDLGPDQLHTNVGGAAGEDCIDCHAHENGFGHGGGSGCIPCHGHDAGYEYQAGEFSEGRGTYQSHSTHTENDTDDVRGPHLPCNECHDTNNFPYFKSGTDGNGDGNYNLAETDVCNNCHSNGGNFDGVNDATYGAKSNWSDGIYDGNNLKPGKERWCASCHDADRASSNQDGTGVTAPAIAGDDTTYGYYYSGHGRNLIVQCTDCHDSSVDHLDGEPRTYAFDSAYYTPAQSGVAYASGYRLRYVDGEVPLMIPANYNITFSFDAGLMKATAFRLCFECHDSSKILDDTPGDGIDSNFKASLPNPPRNYSYAWGSGADINEHVSHIMNYVGPFADSDWDTGTVGAGGMDGRDSLTACSNCHNVHGAAGAEGSTNEPMIRDGSLTGRTGYGFSYVLEDVGSGGYPWVTSTGATQSASVGAIFRDNTADMCAGSMCHGNPAPPPGSSYDATGSSWGTYLEYYHPP